MKWKISDMGCSLVAMMPLLPAIFSSLIMVALCNRADHYIFSCGFYLLLSSFLSSPNLSGRRLDVYHTSTRGVAVVRI